jgi:hypothetical protein
MTTQPKCEVVGDGYDMFIVFDGIRIAKRGHPGTPQAKQWVSLEPGFTVHGGIDEPLVIEHNGSRLQ